MADLDAIREKLEYIEGVASGSLCNVGDIVAKTEGLSIIIDAAHEAMALLKEVSLNG